MPTTPLTRPPIETIDLAKKSPPYLMWLRQDLRVLDNTALHACCEAARAADTGVLAVVYLTPRQWQQHDKSWWQIDLLLRQLGELQQALADCHIGLVVRQVADFAEAQADLVALCEALSISRVFANREYLVNEQQRDERFAMQASQLMIEVAWYDDECVLAPGTITTDKGAPYKVFTPFYKRWLAQLDVTLLQILPVPQPLAVSSVALAKGLNQVVLPVTVSAWISEQHELVLSDSDKAKLRAVARTGRELYPVGEAATLTRLEAFLADDIANYDQARDIPAWHETDGATSRLSPYLAIGMVSARLCYVSAMQQLDTEPTQQTSILRWVSELAWRDFYRDVIVNRPDIVKGQAFLAELDRTVTWRYEEADFSAWCEGRTGVPLVDAAMRCLNATGFMHNRLRMVVAMYLTKNLLIDWRWGERYFMQQLVDGDFASNNGGWQWSASVGNDAQPYFRVMNPFSQAARYDTDAVFIKHWVPELRTVVPAVINDETKLQKQLRQSPNLGYPVLATPTKVSRAYAIGVFKASNVG